MGTRRRGGAAVVAAPQYVDRSEFETEKKREVIDQELNGMLDKHGNLSAELVLEQATSKKHPLHEYFDWDDSSAAHKYRLAQATAMILASKMVVVLDKKRSELPHLVRAYVVPHHGKGYQGRVETLDEDETRAALVRRRMNNLRSWCKETVDIQELTPVREAILNLLP